MTNGPLNKALQQEILIFLRESYPHPVDGFDVQNRFDLPDLIPNLHYLNSHKLISFAYDNLPGPEPFTRIIQVSLTAAGLDYLEEDGGLTARLGVVTVRFESDTLRALLSAKIAESSEPQSVKDRLTDGIRQMPDQALSHLTQRLMEGLIDRTPNLITLLQALI